MPLLSVIDGGILRGYVPIDKDWWGFNINMLQKVPTRALWPNSQFSYLNTLKKAIAIRTCKADNINAMLYASCGWKRTISYRVYGMPHADHHIVDFKLSEVLEI